MQHFREGAFSTSQLVQDQRQLVVMIYRVWSDYWIRKVVIILVGVAKLGTVVG